MPDLPYDLNAGFGSLQAMLGWFIGFAAFVAFLFWVFFVVGVFTFLNCLDRWSDRMGNRMREWRMSRYWKRRRAREAKMKNSS